MIIINVAIFIISLAILIKSSDIFVEYASRIAKYLRISDFVIGLTLVAIGTSLPELGSAIMASIHGSSDLITGMILGSNVANMGLIIGLAAWFTTLKVKEEIWYKDGLLLILFSIIFGLFAFDGIVNFAEGIICLVLIGIYFIRLPKLTKKPTVQEEILKENIRVEEKKKTRNLLKYTGVIILSIGALFLSAEQTVISLTGLASELGIQETIISALMLALGTSLPELVVGIMAVKKKLGDLLIGNIIGSNIFNLLLIGGISALIKPLMISKLALYFMIPVMIIMTIIFLSLIRRDWLLKKFDGTVLLASYVIFIIALLFFI